MSQDPYQILRSISATFKSILDFIDNKLSDNVIDLNLLIYMTIISFILLTLIIGYSIASFDIDLPKPYKDYSKWISIIVVIFTFINSLITMRYFSKLGGEQESNVLQINLTYGKIFKNFVSNGISMGIIYIITSFILSFSNIIYCSNNSSTSTSNGNCNQEDSCGELNNIMTYLTYPFIFSMCYIIVSIFIYKIFNSTPRAKIVPVETPSKKSQEGVKKFLYDGLFNIHKLLEYIIITGLNIYILLNLTNGFVDSFNNICSKTISRTGWNQFIGVLFSIIFLLVTIGGFLLLYYFNEGKQFMKNLFKLAFDIGNYTKDSISELTNESKNTTGSRRKFTIKSKSP
jgi:hypothetical protein